MTVEKRRKARSKYVEKEENIKTKNQKEENTRIKNREERKRDKSEINELEKDKRKEKTFGQGRKRNLPVGKKKDLETRNKVKRNERK